MLTNLSCVPRCTMTSHFLEALARHARERPDQTALMHEGACLSFRELWTRANSVFHALMSTETTGTVAVITPIGFDLVIGCVAAWLTGRPFVLIDPEEPGGRIQHMIEAAGAGVVVLARGQRPPLGIDTQTVVVGGELAGARGVVPANRQPRGEVAYIVFTSGTTGMPKGVPIRHASLQNLSRWYIRTVGLRPGDRLFQASTHTFDVFMLELWPAMSVGATVVLSTEDDRVVLSQLIESMEQVGASVLSCPTLMTEALLAAGAEPPELRVLVTGGAQLHATAQPRGFTVINAYGPTEGTVVTSAFRWTSGDLPIGSRVPIGRPIPGVDVLVVDESLQQVPEGVAGELLIAGIGITSGYLGDPDPHRAAFVSLLGAKYYRSGDRVVWSDENLHFLGRVRSDQQLSVRGMRLEPEEVESALMSLDGVTGAGVVVLGDGASAQLVAGVTAVGPRSDLDLPRLRVGLRRKLPERSFPSRIVVLDALPTTERGKLDRQRLAQLLSQAGS